MVKYASPTPHPVITDPIIQIVNDAVGFVDSEFCYENFKKHHVPFREWKYVKINTHRQAGFSTAALQLLAHHTPSLIMTHSQHAAEVLRRDALNILTSDRNEIKNQITTYSNIESRFKGTKPHYKLIILDNASMMSVMTDYHFTRELLFEHCDVLVELG